MAVTLTESEIAVAIRAAADADNVDGRVLQVLRILVPAGTAIIEAYAPDAPDAVANAALVRLAGWLWDSDPSEDRTGRALQNSGAAALLSIWRRQRAAAVGGTESASPGTPAAGGVPTPPADGHYILTATNGGLAWVAFPLP